MKLLKSIKETFLSSIPLAIVVIVCLCFSPMDSIGDYTRIFMGYLSVIIGQALFLVGLESSILPIGHLVGNSFSKYNKIFFVLSFGFVFGLLATVAEPALAVLAHQITDIMPIVDNSLFVWITSTGIGMGVAFALIRMVKNINIKAVFAILYTLVFLLVAFAPEEFVAISFDGSGATTGDVSVPFILVLGIGISASFSKSKSQDDSFGIIGICSVGPIIVVLLYGIILKAVNGGTLPKANEYQMNIGGNLGEIILGNIKNVALAVFPIVLISIPFLFFLIKIPKKQFIKFMVGVAPVYLGLLIFLSGIDFGFAYVGQYIGKIFFADSAPEFAKWLLLIVGFVLGASITISEPAVTVLGDQIEDLTNGHINQMSIRVTLAIGIGVASTLAILKIITQINILWFLAPMYLIAIVMMKFTPKLFVGLAFDSGGVTGGALTSAFLTPLTLSIAQAVEFTSGKEMSILTNGFGIISFISVTPLIAIQVLGIIYEIRSNKALAIEDDEALEGLEQYINLGGSEHETPAIVSDKTSIKKIIKDTHKKIRRGLRKNGDQ